MGESRRPVGSIRPAWFPQGASVADIDGRKPEHRCGNCFGPLGKSAIPCKNEPKETTRD